MDSALCGVMSRLPGYVAEQGVLFGYAVLLGYVAVQGVLFGYLFCLAILLSRKFLGRTVFFAKPKITYSGYLPYRCVKGLSHG